MLDFLDSLDFGGRLAALKIGIQPGIHQPFRVLFSDHASPEGHHLAIVALAGPLGRINIVTYRGANSWNLIRGDGHANSRAAHKNRAFVLAVGHGVGNLQGNVWIQRRLGVIDSVVLNGMPLLFQIGAHRFLEIVGCLIAAQRNRKFDSYSFLILLHSQNSSPVSRGHLAADRPSWSTLRVVSRLQPSPKQPVLLAAPSQTMSRLAFWLCV